MLEVIITIFLGRRLSRPQRVSVNPPIYLLVVVNTKMRYSLEETMPAPGGLHPAARSSARRLLEPRPVAIEDDGQICSTAH